MTRFEAWLKEQAKNTSTEIAKNNFTWKQYM